MKTNHLKQLWKENKPALGFWASLGSPQIIESAAAWDFDWILIDGEHGLQPYDDCLPFLQALNGSKATALVRVPGFQDMSVFKRVLDRGAEGVLVPQIRTAQEVAQVVSACRYPPVGERGIGPVRAAKYGTDFEDYFQRANEEIAVIVQIETQEAIENIESILQVSGLDAALIGPADLSASLGCPFQWEDSRFIHALETVLKVAHQIEKPLGIFSFSAKDAKNRIEQGFSFVNLCDDVALFAQGLKAVFEEMQSDDGC